MKFALPDHALDQLVLCRQKMRMGSLPDPIQTTPDPQKENPMTETRIPVDSFGAWIDGAAATKYPSRDQQLDHTPTQGVMLKTRLGNFFFLSQQDGQPTYEPMSPYEVESFRLNHGYRTKDVLDQIGADPAEARPRLNEM